MYILASQGCFPKAEGLRNVKLKPVGALQASATGAEFLCSHEVFMNEILSLFFLSA